MFNSHGNFSAEWCFKTIVSEEGKTYNDKDDKFRCKKNDNQMYNILKILFCCFKQTKFWNNHCICLTHKKRINEQCDSIRCAKKQDDGVYHETKQRDLLCGGNIHLWVQEILETSVLFDGDTNNPNIQIFIASQNNQRREEQVILSTIRCKVTESFPQAGNDEITNLREHACKAKWDGI